MKLDNVIKPDSVLCNVSARSKKHCLEILSELLTRSNPDIAHEDVFAALVERERLGCTCLDKGIAFPHCRIAGLREPCAALLKLLDPVDFDSPDGESVDLIFGLMVPEDLDDGDIADVNSLAGVLRDQGLAARLREAGSSSDLYVALLDGAPEELPTGSRASDAVPADETAA